MPEADCMASLEQSHQTPRLRDLYPDLDEAELQQVEEDIEIYLKGIIRIIDRLEVEEHGPAV